MQAWSESDSIELVCLKKWHETADTVSLELGYSDQERTFEFKPGQFVTLGLNMPEQFEYRAYSISSAPNGSSLKLTVKRVEGGIVSNFIVDELDEGDEIDVLKPAGGFNCVDCVPSTSNKVTLVSAGCGITPVMAMVRYWLSFDSGIEIDFIHMARDRQQTIYYRELVQLEKEHPNFNLRLLLKDNTDTNCPQGRLDKNWLVKLSPDIQDRTVYLCGPVGFMQDVESYLKEIDFNMANFYQESFTPKPVESTPMANEESGTEQSAVNVFVPSFGVELEAEKGSPLIDSLEKGGVPVIAACRSGICGSCKCKVDKGTVTTTSTETLTPEEIEQGYVLACSSTIQSDLEVSL
ncbi:hybrid-cluster NAD(P)-dependent oxidoreductase [Vibrio makurazakiensis]|uniref:2Fe-2S iron-sulfur cluster-binding protein n=1 Tax=Vibrio makurazakiensis TaxID=2910250 RepID=UPI003D12F610